MKKLILSCIILIMLSAAAYAAAPEISVYDVENDIINITGSAEGDFRAVSAVVLNPGYTESDITQENYAAQTAAVCYMGAAYPQNGIYSINVPMKDATAPQQGGGIYKIIVTDGSNRLYDGDYTFYFNSAKLKVIDALNAQNGIDVQSTGDAYEKYGLSEYPLYKNTGISSIAAALKNLQSENGDSFARNTALFERILKQAAMLAAFNESQAAVLTSADGSLNCISLMYNTDGAALNAKETADYAASLSGEGRAALNAEMISASYTRIAGIKNSFRELVAYYGIVKNKDRGFGHIDTYFNNYADIYAKYGFKTELITEDNKNTVYSELIKKSTRSITELAAEFNALAGGTNQGSGGGAGGNTGGSAAGSGGGGALRDNLYIEREITFSDLAGYSWAEEAINALAKKGVINGKSDAIFAPSDNVTRAEFLKMLTAALDIKAGGECPFNDVPDDWSKPYITTAYNAGIANGTADSTFEPNRPITREMGAVFAARALRFKGISAQKDEVKFSDNESISDYAKDSVYVMKYAGIISGVGDNTFAPQETMTRAQAAKIIYGMLAYIKGEGTV